MSFFPVSACLFLVAANALVNNNSSDIRNTHTHTHTHYTHTHTHTHSHTHTHTNTLHTHTNTRTHERTHTAIAKQKSFLCSRDELFIWRQALLYRLNHEQLPSNTNVTIETRDFNEDV